MDAEEDQLYGEQRGDELPKEIQSKVSLRKKIKEVLRQWKGEEKEKINLTDPESRFMKERKGVIVPSYNCQVAVTEGQVIVGADVVMEENDRKQLVPMVEQAEATLGSIISGKSLRTVAMGVMATTNTYRSMRRRVTFRTNTLRKSSMGNMRRLRISIIRRTFDMTEERDLYICPEGKELPFYKERDSEEGVIPRKQWIYKGEDCVPLPGFRPMYQGEISDHCS